MKKGGILKIDLLPVLGVMGLIFVILYFLLANLTGEAADRYRGLYAAVRQVDRRHSRAWKCHRGALGDPRDVARRGAPHRVRASREHRCQEREHQPQDEGLGGPCGPRRPLSPGHRPRRRAGRTRANPPPHLPARSRR